MIRVLVADDEALMRAGIRLILENGEDIEVVAEAGDGREAVEACRAQDIDVALLDIQMPGTDGIAAAADIARLAPRTCVVMLTAFGEEAGVTRALRAGASGFLLKDTSPADLIRAVQLAARGEPVLAPRITRQLLDRQVRSGRDTEAALRRTDELTPAERDVLRLLGTGLSNAEIAGQLYLSAGTVKAHISRILTRTGCANRVQAAVLAHDAGLLGERCAGPPTSPDRRPPNTSVSTGPCTPASPSRSSYGVRARPCRCRCCATRCRWCRGRRCPPCRRR